jgi:hypothetical protein
VNFSLISPMAQTIENRTAATDNIPIIGGQRMQMIINSKSSTMQQSIIKNNFKCNF